MSRIVRLANFYGPESGGIRTTLHNLGRGYADAGHEPFLIVPGESDCAVSDASGVRISVAGHRLPGAGGYRVITARRHVEELLVRLRPDRVEVSDKLTLVWVGRWAARRGIPAVLFSHERVDAILSPRVPGWFPLARCADRWNAHVAGAFDAVICPSRFAAAEFLRIGMGNVTVVPLGVDLQTFTPSPDGTRFGPVELITVGRLSKEKRPDLTIAALEVLRGEGVDARLTIVGAGPMRAQLEHAAVRLPVTFLGHVDDRRELARTVARCDVALAPCPAETFGLSVLEALAAGTPVVTADRGAAPELIDALSGRAAPCDATSIASAVRELLAIPEGLRRSAARQRAERYPWSATVSGLLRAHRLADERVESAS